MVYELLGKHLSRVSVVSNQVCFDEARLRIPSSGDVFCFVHDSSVHEVLIVFVYILLPFPIFYQQIQLKFFVTCGPLFLIPTNVGKR